jgi:subtilisin-like proprotein convertase family protein
VGVFSSSRTRAATVVVAACVLGLGMTPSVAGAKPNDTDQALAQIAQLQQIKRSLSATERKLDSRLAVELRRRRNATPSTLAQLSTGLDVAADGTVRVEVHATSINNDLLDRLRKVGAKIRYPSPKTGSVVVQAPLSAVSTIASWPDVTRVDIASGALSAHESAPAGTARVAPESKQAKASRIAAALRAAQVRAAPAGAVVSEGDRTEAVDTARTKFKVTGVGVKVCVLSDGIDSLAVSQTAGELPPDVDVLPGQQGSGDEGTAMLEIVHDLAPNAKLGFATAFISEQSFADNIRALRFTAHCSIIVDDVLYFHEDPFQDGTVAQSVNAVTADGAYYFSSAGNEGNTIDGTAGNYETDFVDSGLGVGKIAGQAHDFDPGPDVQVFDPLSANSTGVPVTLWWADPLGASGNDYDLYVFDATGKMVAFSQNVQDGNDDPWEILSTPFGTGLRLAVVKFSGEARYFQLSALRGRFADSADGLKAFATPGATRGHSAAAQAFSVAAAPAHSALPFPLEPGDPANPMGPYPDVFTGQSQPERFTSDGPRRVFFNADGSPVTPGNFTSTGGTVRQKPEITAADGVATSLSAFSPFFGTSAAAPHAAGIAALALSGNPGLSNADIRAALYAGSVDLAPAGTDDRTGHGVLRADLVLRTTGATPQPLVVAGTPTVTPTTGDGDPFFEPGEQATMSLPVTNIGDGRATGVSVVVGTSDVGVTVRPPAHAYGGVAPGVTKSKDFTLALATTYPVGRPIRLSVKVTFAGVLSPTTKTLVIPTGQPSATVQTFAYAGSPVPVPDADPTGASATVTVSGVGYASALTFSIDGTACSTDRGSTTVGLDHTFVSDLVGTLTGPDGTTASLFTRIGGSGTNMCQVVFDDGATTPISSARSFDAPFTGTWRPNSPLAALLSAPVDGTWTFHVVDVAALDSGTIRAFSLHINGFEPV